jgi:hypothetical protein
MVKKSKTQDFEIPHSINIASSQVHFGNGDNTKIQNQNTPEGTLSKYWWLLVVPIIVAVVATWLTNIGKSVPILNFTKISTSLNDRIVTTTVNITDIFEKSTEFNTSLEKQNFFIKYKDNFVYGVGSFNDINKIGDLYYLFLYIKQIPVACSFESIDPETEKKLLLLKSNDKVYFSGIFTDQRLNLSATWYVEQCTLLNL